MRAVSAAILACIGAASGCGPSATEGGFDSPNPAARMYAIEQAARVGDRAALRSIVEQLDCDDPAVRMLAISTLERMTGQTYGYRHYDDAAERRQAIARWVKAVESGEIDRSIQPMNLDPAAPAGSRQGSGNQADCDTGSWHAWALAPPATRTLITSPTPSPPARKPPACRPVVAASETDHAHEG